MPNEWDRLSLEELKEFERQTENKRDQAATDREALVIHCRLSAIREAIARKEGERK